MQNDHNIDDYALADVRFPVCFRCSGFTGFSASSLDGHHLTSSVLRTAVLSAAASLNAPFFASFQSHRFLGDTSL